ncbi:hypothetical protein VF14_18240 [Nostoc linckia z18]|uniref:Uncharacterized protein n=2 Tax=Nostoc linckia TaxID=92942 RepID=A0A9Q5Z565_NOSLI|nr:hypothetical protein VF04_38060 [Nostoc linckia z7]PHJ94023.1 hypothetical protein VF08_34400 [Nostoc linckia z8]PHK05053.1 hypothetical protein VF10_38015 [Nostoc linckia z13]PHK09330.1 hypothetical protein VF09_16065 [Nostoc linckia z9]PHK33066.1 hypothetical protein VF14_18240 [Nostoc linckia z18]
MVSLLRGFAPGARKGKGAPLPKREEFSPAFGIPRAAKFLSFRPCTCLPTLAGGQGLMFVTSTRNERKQNEKAEIP